MKSIIYILLFFSLNLFSQENNPVVHLRHYSFGIDTEYFITIQPDKKSKIVYLKVFKEKDSELDYKNPKILEIKFKQYKKVLNSILEMSPKDLIIDTGLMSEAPTFTLGVGDADNGIEYHIKGVHSGLLNTKFEDFFKATKLILELAELKEKGITE
jgi:hypothetical protein